MKSILFKPHLVAQIFAGNKTHTRRVIKTKLGWKLKEYKGCDGIYHNFENEISLSVQTSIKPKYSVGETIYVKEKLIRNCCGGISFEDGDPIGVTDWAWKRDVLSPLFMPEKHARLFMRVTDVRVERLQDISEEDAVKEGVEYETVVAGVGCVPVKSYKNYLTGKYEFSTARESFFTLIASIHGQELLEGNPWVFVYEFERVEKP